MRARHAESLLAFVADFWHILEPGREFVTGAAIEAIALHLEAVSRGDIQYLLINCPPGLMKSLLVSVFWPAWEWAVKSKTLGFLTSSFALPNVIRDNNKFRRLVTSELYQGLYGDRVKPSAKWGERRMETEATGVREGRSFEGMTGGRGDRVIIDDPHSVDGGESEDQRNSTVQTFREAIPDRLNDMQKSAIVVIMQRLHANDVSGEIKKVGLPYVHLNLPMEFEEWREENGVKIDARCRTYDDQGRFLFEDWRKHDGELLFPERFPREVVEGLKIAKGSYAYAGQYQQRPTAREGGLFKRSWFAGKIIDRARVPALHYRCRAWDFAATEESAATDPDWTAGVRGGRHGVDYYIENAQKDRLSPAMVQRLVKQNAEIDPPGTLIRLPRDPGQAGVDQAHGYVTALAGYPVKIEPVSKNKVNRATPLAIQAEFGHVYLVNSGPPEEGLDAWIEQFLDELCAFPSGAHDDQVDAASDMFNELALNDQIPFSSMSIGRSDIVQQVERDTRYQFRDNAIPNSGRGFGTAPSSTRGISF